MSRFNQLNWSSKEAARRLNVSETEMREILAGTTQDIDGRVLLKLHESLRQRFIELVSALGFKPDDYIGAAKFLKLSPNFVRMVRMGTRVPGARLLDLMATKALEAKEFKVDPETLMLVEEFRSLDPKARKQLIEPMRGLIRLYRKKGSG